jgi:hypothetical protein
VTAQAEYLQATTGNALRVIALAHKIADDGYYRVVAFAMLDLEVILARRDKKHGNAIDVADISGFVAFAGFSEVFPFVQTFWVTGKIRCGFNQAVAAAKAKLSRRALDFQMIEQVFVETPVYNCEVL